MHFAQLQLLRSAFTYSEQGGAAKGGARGVGAGSIAQGGGSACSGTWSRS